MANTSILHALTLTRSEAREFFSHMNELRCCATAVCGHFDLCPKYDISFVR